jgi:hypothetical protein
VAGADLVLIVTFLIVTFLIVTFPIVTFPIVTFPIVTRCAGCITVGLWAMSMNRASPRPEPIRPRAPGGPALPGCTTIFWAVRTTSLPGVLRANRDFLRRAVAHLARQGVRQFLDLGSGIPTVGNVHEVARAIAPQSRVAYVDLDPVAVLTADEVLEEVPDTAMVRADLRYPGQILTHPEVTRLLDLTRPVAVLMVAVLHLIPDAEDPAGILRDLHDGVPPGSFLALSHMSPPERQTPAGMSAAQDSYARSGNQLYPRTLAQIEALLGDWHLQPPGLVACPQWRPDTDDPPPPLNTTFPGYAGLAEKPPAPSRDSTARRSGIPGIRLD